MFRLRFCQLARDAFSFRLAVPGATTVSRSMAFSNRFPHLSTRRPREKPVTAGTPFFSILVGRVSGRLSTPRAEQDADTDMEDALYDGRSAAVLST